MNHLEILKDVWAEMTQTATESVEYRISPHEEDQDIEQHKEEVEASEIKRVTEMKKHLNGLALQQSHYLEVAKQNNENGKEAVEGIKKIVSLNEKLVESLVSYLEFLKNKV